MQSPYSFIVTPLKNRRYDNIKMYGDKKFYTSVSEEDHTVSNRFAKVINVPINYKGEVQIGDTLLVHHNVFKFYNDMYGKRQSGKSWLKDNLFLVDPDQFFLYKRNDEWKGYDKYCFIKPLPKKDFYLDGVGVHEEPLCGKIKYSNQQLEKLGLNVGDEVSYQPDTEYVFYIDEEKLYRMFTNNITMLI